jgi:hypothetical protein
MPYPLLPSRRPALIMVTATLDMPTLLTLNFMFLLIPSLEKVLTGISNLPTCQQGARGYQGLSYFHDLAALHYDFGSATSFHYMLIEHMSQRYES